MEGDSKLQYVLTDSNYLTWNARVRLLLGSRDCVKAIDRDLSEGTVAEKKQNSKALHLIAQSLNDVDLSIIKDCGSAFQAWERLKGIHQDSSGVLIQETVKKLSMLKIEPGEAKAKVQEFGMLCEKLEALLDTKISEALLGHMLLSKLPETFDGMAHSFITMKQTDLKISEIKQAIMAKDITASQEPSRALSTKSFIDKRKKKNFKCYKCDKFGHIARDCKVAVTVVESINKDSKDCSVVSLNFIGNLAEQQTDVWILDSGASHHNVVDRTRFHDFDEKQLSVVGASRESSSVTGIGKVQIECRVAGEWSSLLLTNVRCAPGLLCNVISISQLIECGASVRFSRTGALVMLGGKVIMEAKLNSAGLYVIQVKTSKRSNQSFANISWHDRFGHPGTEATRLIKKLYPKVDIHVVDSCDTCNRAKMKQLPYPVSEDRATKPLDLVHADVCGPIFPADFYGNKYFLVFYDDFTQYSVVYLLKEKSEVFNNFKDFKAYIENRTGHKIKNFKTDNGREFVSGDFQQYLSEAGIHKMNSVAYCHPQNGRAERAIQRIQQTARAMMVHANARPTMWGQAVLTATYLNNRTPSRVSGKIPYELMYGKKTSVAHLHTFGSVAYRWIPKELRRKFEPTGERLMLIGYSDQHKAYKLYDPKTRKIIIDRNVKFFDDMMYYTEESAEGVQFPEEDQPTRLTRSAAAAQGLVMATDGSEPLTYEKAMESDLADDWRRAILEESNSLVEHQTYEEVDDKGQRSIDSKWVFSEKTNSDGMVVRRKARLVAKGFRQKYGIDFDETFAPVCEKTTIRVMLTLASVKKWKVHHFDVKSAFLNGDLEEDIYVRPPDPLRKEGKLWKLRKALYGLKQASKCWNDYLNSLLCSAGFVASHMDPCLYFKNETFVLAYVDDLLVFSKELVQIDQIRDLLSSKMSIHDLGPVKKFLGINVDQSNGAYRIDQNEYIMKLATRFNLHECYRVNKPLPAGIDQLDKTATEECAYPIRSLIGGLLFIANSTRPDILASVSLLSRYLEKPSKLLWTYACHMMRYLVSTRNLKLQLGKTSETQLALYVDADYASDVVSRKSQSGALVKLYGSTISWFSRKQPTVSTSSGEAEYVALAAGCSEIVGLIQLLEEIGVPIDKPVKVFEDSRTCLSMVKGGTRVKHLDIKLKFIQDLSKKGIILLEYIPSQDQAADVLTKAHPKVRFEVICKEQLGLVSGQGEVL